MTSTIHTTPSHVDPPIERDRNLSEAPYAMVGLLAATLAAWSASLVSLPVDSDFGLVARLPATYWVGLLVLNVMFMATLFGRQRNRPNPWLMTLLTAALVVVLFGAAAMVTDYPRGEVAWRHIGIADALAQTGSIDPDVDAYFSWPGFFALLAVFLGATGIAPLDVAVWAPVFNMGLWLVALAVLVRSLTTDARRLWLTLWLFCLGNWHDQDYLSPQAFAFFLYLVVLVLLLRPLRADAPPLRGRRPPDLLAWWRGRTPTEPDPRRRVGALLVCLLLVIVICASHQLTPFMLLVAVMALTLSGRTWAQGLPLLVMIALGIWLAYPASAYLIGHPPLADLGMESAAAANVTDRVAGTPGHVVVVQLRMGLSVLMWVLAAIGVLLERRRGQLDIRPVLLAASPFILLPAQSYGGEMLIRVSLFALPFTAYLAAAALLPFRRAASPRRAVRLGALCGLLAVLTVTARYGNTQFDMFTQNEITASQKMYQLAPKGAAIISGAHPTPWRSREYLGHKYRTVKDLCQLDHEANACGEVVYAYARRNPAGAVLLMNRAAKSSMVMQGVLTPGTFEEFEQWLGHRDTIHLVYKNPDARIYRIDPR